jgi:AcrR family transcriptional regulator
MGRTPQIDRAAILEAAMRLADQAGLEAVTMHAVARLLGVTPMALYRHVDSKDALLDGLVEQLLTSFPAQPDTGSWDDRLTAMADAIRAVARRHPAVFPLLLTRPAVTPGALRVRDGAQAALTEAGIPRDQVARTERLLATAILGFAASEVAGRFRERDQDVIDQDFAELIRWLSIAVATLRQLARPGASRPGRPGPVGRDQVAAYTRSAKLYTSPWDRLLAMSASLIMPTSFLSSITGSRLIWYFFISASVSPMLASASIQRGVPSAS